MARALVVVVGVVVVSLAVVWVLQRRLIYFPSPGPVSDASTMVEGARDVTLETSDGLRLGAWFVSPRAPETGLYRTGRQRQRG